jgi:general secretion pathway protein B
MSFIIKALQKLEEENAARQAEPAAIERAILAPVACSAAGPRRALKWPVIVLVFIAGGAMTYLLLPRPVVSVAPRQEPALAPSAPAASIPPAVQARPAATTAHAGEPSVSPPPVTAESSPAAAGIAGTPRAAARRRAHLDREKPEGNTSAVAVPSPAPVEAPPVQLAVNGIAFQDDPWASSAVVNGALVKRGMTVGGARVERIFQDKVRFSHNGSSFEVPLAK